MFSVQAGIRKLAMIICNSVWLRISTLALHWDNICHYKRLWTDDDDGDDDGDDDDDDDDDGGGDDDDAGSGVQAAMD